MKPRHYFEKEAQVELAEAIEKGDQGRMRKAVQQGADVNAIGRQDMRPLFWALGKQSVEGFKFLLENDADANIEAKGLPGQNRPLPLIELAAVAEDSDYLRLLLEHGADPNHALGYGERTVIYEAVMNNRTDNVRLLIEAGADLNHQDLSGETPLLSAASIKNFDMVYLFLESGADPRIENRWGVDLVERINKYGGRGMKRGGDQYRWYRKVVKMLESEGSLGDRK